MPEKYLCVFHFDTDKNEYIFTNSKNSGQNHLYIQRNRAATKTPLGCFGNVGLLYFLPRGFHSGHLKQFRSEQQKNGAVSTVQHPGCH